MKGKITLYAHLNLQCNPDRKAVGRRRNKAEPKFLKFKNISSKMKPQRSVKLTFHGSSTSFHLPRTWQFTKEASLANNGEGNASLLTLRGENVLKFTFAWLCFVLLLCWLDSVEFMHTHAGTDPHTLRSRPINLERLHSRCLCEGFPHRVEILISNLTLFKFKAVSHEGATSSVVGGSNPIGCQQLIE